MMQNGNGNMGTNIIRSCERSFGGELRVYMHCI